VEYAFRSWINEIVNLVFGSSNIYCLLQMFYILDLEYVEYRYNITSVICAQIFKPRELNNCIY